MAVTTLEDEVYELLKEMLSTLPDGTAALKRQRSTDPAGGEDLQLVPVNRECAQISVHPGVGVIYAGFGRHTSMEFWVSTPRQEKQGLVALRKMSRAVLDGKFSEDVWTSNGRVARSVGVFEIDGKKQKKGGLFTFLYPFRRKQRQHYDYPPYVMPSQ